MSDSSRVKINVLMAAILFGTMEVVLKIAGSGLDSWQLTVIRFIIGALVLIPFALKDYKVRELHLKAKDHLWFLFLGIVCIPISMLFFQLGVEHSNASTCSVLFCTNPLFVMLIAHFFTEEKMTKLKVVALFVSLIGIIFMIRPWELQEGNSIVGFIYTMIAAVSFSIYTVIGKRTIGKFGNLVQTAFSFLYGSIMMLIIMLFMGKPVIAGVMDHVPLIAYIGIFVTGMGYFCFFRAIQFSNAVTGSVTFLIKPAISPIFAVIVLHESLMWNTIVGIVLILCASYINISENFKKQGR